MSKGGGIKGPLENTQLVFEDQGPVAPTSTSGEERPPPAIYAQYMREPSSVSSGTYHVQK